MAAKVNDNMGIANGQTVPEDCTLADAPVPKKGRLFRRRQVTRARLLRAGFEIMSDVGVDGAKIKDITDRTDIGFGTFYSYFTSKDELAQQILDCMIEDCGRRNVIATRNLRGKDPALVIPVSTRLLIREATRTPVWQWWARRPDLLIDRVREGFRPFARRDMQDAIERGLFTMAEGEVDWAWGLASWMIAGGVHDIVTGKRPLESESFVVESIMKMMGVEANLAQRISSSALPAYPASDVDWTYELAGARAAES